MISANNINIITAAITTSGNGNVAAIGVDFENGTIESAKIISTPEVILRPKAAPRRLRTDIESLSEHAVGVFWKVWEENADLAYHRVEIENVLREIAASPYRAMEVFEIRRIEASSRYIARHWRVAAYLAYAAWQRQLTGMRRPWRPQLAKGRVPAYDSPAFPNAKVKDVPIFDLDRHDRHGNVPEIPRHIAAENWAATSVEKTLWRVVEDRHGQERYRFPVARFEPATPGAVCQDGNWVTTTPEWPEAAAWAAIVATPDGAAFCAERRAEYRLQLQKVFPVKGRVPYRITPEVGQAAFDALTRAGEGETPCPVAMAAIDAARKVGAGVETDAAIAARAAREVEALAFPEARRPSPFNPIAWARARRNGRRGMRRPKWAPMPRQTGVVADPPLTPTVDWKAARRVKARRLAIEAKDAAKLARAAMAEAESRLAFAKSLSGPGSRVHRAAKLAASAEARDAIGKAEVLKARAAKLARAARAAIAEAKNDE